MNKLDTGRWQLLSPLLDELLDVDEATRERRLRELQLTDAALAGELVKLLERCQRMDAAKFLEPEVMANTVIGSYRLVRQLGQGGMGAVWLAERSDGRYEGQAAIKFLNPALAADATSRARFHREGNALARLNHPNIARLLDSGVSAEGQPFLVLEYVAGQPIDSWCEQYQLGVSAKVRLLLEVLQAVQHAHGRLILHRDLKPANILVTAEGQVKLLDFGIAKLLAADSALSTAELTAFNARWFTLDYASPEQVLGEEVTMASDVYALGVMLYGLLTGQHPTAGVTQAPWARMRDIVEREPLPPSKVLARLGQSQLQQRALRGDLDWIVLRALKVDVTQRYPTAAAFADDLRRYLQDEPVLARPDSAWYRARKFAARNRVGVLGVLGIVIALTVGLATSLSQLRVARAERQRAEQVKDFITSIFRDADPFQIGDAPVNAADLLSNATQRVETELSAQPSIGLELLYVIGNSQRQIGRFEDARLTFGKLLSLSNRNDNRLYAAAARTGLADVELGNGRGTAAQQQLTPALTELRSAGAAGVPMLIDALVLQGELHSFHRATDAALAAGSEALGLARTHLGTSNEATLRAAATLGDLQLRARRYDEAIATVRPLLESASNASLAVLADLKSTHGNALAANGQAKEGIELLQQAVEHAKATYGAETEWVATYLGYLGNAQQSVGDVSGAITTLQRALAASRNAVARAEMRGTLGAYLLYGGRAVDAVPVLKQAVEELRQLGTESWFLPNVVTTYGQALVASGDFAGGEEILRSNLTAKEPFALAMAQAELGLLALRRGDLTASESWFELSVAAGTSGDVLAGLGQLQLAQGKLLEAERTLQQSEQRLRGKANVVNPRVAAVLVTRGKVALARGDQPAAQDLFAQSVRFWRGLDPDNPAAREAAEWQARAAAR